VHSAGEGHATPSPLRVNADLSSSQWNQLITHVAELLAPKVAVNRP
jgi:hypothetical protein